MSLSTITTAAPSPYCVEEIDEDHKDREREESIEKPGDISAEHSPEEHAAELQRRLRALLLKSEDHNELPYIRLMAFVTILADMWKDVRR
jgi:hypothetical protein